MSVPQKNNKLIGPVCSQSMDEIILLKMLFLTLALKYTEDTVRDFLDGTTIWGRPPRETRKSSTGPLHYYAAIDSSNSGTTSS